MNEKKKAPKGEVIRVFPKYDKLPKKEKVSVLLEVLSWARAELIRNLKTKK
jgi:hypothetical protein